MAPIVRARERATGARHRDSGTRNVAGPAHTAHPRKLVEQEVRKPPRMRPWLPRVRERGPVECGKSSRQLQEVSSKSWRRHVHTTHMDLRERNASWSIRKCARRARCTCHSILVLEEWLMSFCAEITNAGEEASIYWKRLWPASTRDSISRRVNPQGTTSSDPGTGDAAAHHAGKVVLERLNCASRHAAEEGLQV